MEGIELDVQGLHGNPYRLLLGDAKDYFVMQKKVQSKPMIFSDDIAPRVAPYIHHAVQTHGKKSFIWFGTKPWVILNEPEQIREVFNKISEFPKIMTPTFLKSCNDLISNWEETLSSSGASEIDIWPSLQSLTSDVIARSSFGSSYEEGRKVFQLQIEQGELIMKNLMKSLIPLWRFLPTADHRKINENLSGLGLIHFKLLGVAGC
ncbi:cytochrome P450 family 72 protein, putative [Medicago truncatula]|uniref:Cytochrome P450 family 72 protein, putative n=1 Tax=Medicago truncatula TaxID=3880 RepID=A0A072VIL4_MEDTR|nr:cytochrome P450 family 72 protein, putative [Medicago truncatula]